MPCARMAAACSALSRSASRPPWTAGCSVFTRPSIISGKPVTSDDVAHRSPASASAARAAGRDELDAVPASARAKSISPVLSETEIRAREMRRRMAVSWRGGITAEKGCHARRPRLVQWHLRSAQRSSRGDPPWIVTGASRSLASYKAVSYMRAMKVVATLGYDRRARKLFTPTERAAAELEIVLSPTAWPVIRGTGGARKARAARGGRGKSGGVRIIYFVVSRRGVIYLIDIYAKSEKEDLTDAERREIRKLVVALEAEG